MVTVPKIALPVPTLRDSAYNDRSLPHYISALRLAGAEPVLVSLELDATELQRLADTCDGICLPGSPADVEPERYGAERDPATAEADLQRESVDYFLLTHAWATGKPVLAICFGCQSLNVWRGGTLVQDLLPLPVNHSAGSSVAIAHSIVVARDSLLGSIIQADSDASAETSSIDEAFLRVPINTSHHQAVSQPGEDLRVSARSAEDGVVEAIELQSMLEDEAKSQYSAPFVLGVQWHPERSYEISATSRALFARLVAETARR